MLLIAKKIKILLGLHLLNFLFISSVYAIDLYESDDSMGSASALYVGALDAQEHDFHDENDRDWVKFYAQAGLQFPYNVEVKNQGENANVILSFYDSYGRHIETINGGQAGAGEFELHDFEPPSDGYYYVKITNDVLHVMPGDDSGYQLRLYHAVMQFDGRIAGTVIDAVSGIPVASTVVATSSLERGRQISDANGNFIMFHPAGTYNITFQAPGYRTGIIEGVEVIERISGVDLIGNVLLNPEDNSENNITDVNFSSSNGKLIIPDVSNAETGERFSVSSRWTGTSDFQFTIEELETLPGNNEQSQNVYHLSSSAIHIPKLLFDGEEQGPVLIRMVPESNQNSGSLKFLNSPDEPSKVRFVSAHGLLVAPVVSLSENLNLSVIFQWLENTEYDFMLKSYALLLDVPDTLVYPDFNEANMELTLPDVFVDDSSIGSVILEYVPGSNPLIFRLQNK
jgi:hypothetical protein